MLRLPSNLYHRLRDILLECDEFKNNASLEALFVTEELSPFQDRLPGAASKAERVNNCLDLLRSKRLPGNRPVLPVFLEILRDNHPPGDGLHDDLDALAKDVRQVITPSTNESLAPLAAYEAIMTSAFDLDEIIDDCLDAMYNKHGLVGFLLPCDSISLLENLCERLQREWVETQPNQVCLKPALSINPISNQIDKVILTITRNYTPMLQKRDVLCVVQCSQESVMNTFWQNLCSALEGGEFHNRLIVIMTVQENSDSPEDMLKLCQPCFRKAHALRWVRRIIQRLAWPEHLIKTWTDQIIAECSHENVLQVDWVYAHLKDMAELFKQNPTCDSFQHELEKRREPYVQTSN